MDEFEKWMGFARTFPLLIGNPIYHWTSLELKRYFDIDTPLTEETAKEIWDKCNELLKKEEFSAQNLIKRSNVEIICTTDDPADDLRYHIQLREEGFPTKVLPTMRPDKLVNIDKVEFMGYIKENGIETYEQALSWIADRIEFFNDNGCKLSDHALEYVPFALGDAKAAFDKKISGKELTQEEIDIYKTAILSECAKHYRCTQK